MSDIDLDAAVNAAAREMYAYNRVPDDEMWPEWDALIKGSAGQQWQAIGYRDMARRAFAEFAPVIEAQVRALEPAESIALTMALAQVRRGDAPTPNVATVCVQALARIARGVTS